MMFVFSVCRLVSRRCHSISALHRLCLPPSQNRTNGFPISGSSFKHSAWQKDSGWPECAPEASRHAAGLIGKLPRCRTCVGYDDWAIWRVLDASDAYPYNVTWLMASHTCFCVMWWLPTSHALPGVRSARGSLHHSPAGPWDTSPQPGCRQGPGHGQDPQPMEVFW